MREFKDIYFFHLYTMATGKRICTSLAFGCCVLACFMFYFFFLGLHTWITKHEIDLFNGFFTIFEALFIHINARRILTVKKNLKTLEKNYKGYQKERDEYLSEVFIHTSNR